MGLFDMFDVGNLFTAFNQSREADAEKTQPIRVVVCVDPETSPELIPPLKEALMPQTSHAVVNVIRLDSPDSFSPDPSTDIALVVCGGSMNLCHETAVRWLKANVPTVLLGRSTVEVPGATLGSQVAERLCVSDPCELVKDLGHWIVANTNKDVAFAANFPFCRWAAANELIQAVALSNAAVCVFNFVPGIVDFTLVTANEIKLALDLAAIYDEELSLARVPEIISILAFGFVIRSVAMGIQRFVPQLGWLLRGVAGYGGALVTGHALVDHYQGQGMIDEGINGVVEVAQEWKDVIQEKIGTLTGEVVRLGPGATYTQPKSAQSAGRSSQEDVEETQPAPTPQWVEIGAQSAL